MKNFILSFLISVLLSIFLVVLAYYDEKLLITFLMLLVGFATYLIVRGD